MFGIFKRRLAIDADEFDWLMACYAWLLEEFGGVERLRRTPLVLPTDFRQVARRGMRGRWRCSSG